MNECFQSSKTILPYGAVLTTIFEAFDVHIMVDDEVVKVKRSDIYNYASLRHMGYTFYDGVWMRMSTVDEEEHDGKGGGQPTDREQHTHIIQFDQQSSDQHALSARIDALEISVSEIFAHMNARLDERFA